MWGEFQVKRRKKYQQDKLPKNKCRHMNMNKTKHQHIQTATDTRDFFPRQVEMLITGRHLMFKLDKHHIPPITWYLQVKSHENSTRFSRGTSTSNCFHFNFKFHFILFKKWLAISFNLTSKQQLVMIPIAKKPELHPLKVELW